jgi:CheY-like chemotaxis protein
MAKIVVTNSALVGASHELGGNWATLGRADGNTFQLLDTSVSGRHCEVRVLGEELAVHDLISTNGTFIDGKKISEGVLKPGQVLRLGDVELRFEASPPAAAGASFNSKMLVTSAASRAASKSVPSPPAPESKPAVPPPSGAEPVRKFHVLLVDDSLAFLELFGAVCSEYSNHAWEILSATSADRALVILQEKPVDLVVLDIGMPMLDGLQLLAIIGRRYPGLKTAIMTGHATEAKRADALAKGAALFLEKPAAPEGLKSAFNLLSDLVSWPPRAGSNGAPKSAGDTSLLPPPQSSPPPEPPAETVDHALGDEIVVVATYDGTWKPAVDPKSNPEK